MSRDDWRRVSRQTPCPICHRPDWCLISADGSAAICARVCDGAVKAVGDRGAGWLHRLHDQGDLRRRLRLELKTRQTLDLEALVERYVAAVSSVKLAGLAGQLGVTSESLQRLDVGHDGEAWTFPMRQYNGRIVGIRRRLPSGRKLAVRGGHEGLFVPTGLDHATELVICEGPTDTAALLDLGFSATGRPSCMGGGRLMVQLVQRLRPNSVVVVSDRDASGLRGATALASDLRLHSRDVRVVTPPSEINDARAWRQAGATRPTIEAAIANSPMMSLTVRGVSA